MISTRGSILIETLIERCKDIEKLSDQAAFNKSIVASIVTRVKTCAAMVEYIRGQELNPENEDAALRLFENLQELEDYIKCISEKSLIIKVWNGSFIIKDIEELFAKISGSISDLEVPHYILLNKNSSNLQKKVAESINDLKKALSKLSSPADLTKPEAIEIITQILECSQESVLQAYDFFKKNFRKKEKQIQRKIDEFLFRNEIAKYAFTDTEASNFWRRNFASKGFVFFFQFARAMEKEYLRLYSNDKIEEVVNRIRKHVDKEYSGVVLQRSCNEFFERVWNVTRSDFLEAGGRTKIWKNVFLSISVACCMSQDLKIGMSFTIDSKGYAFSPHPRNDGMTIIGRNPGEVDLLINEGSISAIHGLVSFFPASGFKYTDLGSSAGSFIQIQEPLLLKPGMLIQLASTQIMLIRKSIKKSKPKTQSPIKDFNKIFLDQYEKDQTKNVISLQVTDLEDYSRTENQRLKDLPQGIIDTIIELNSEQEETVIDKPADSRLFRSDLIEESKEDIKQISLEENEEELSIDSYDSDKVSGISELEIEFVLKGCNKGRVFKFSDSTENISIGRDGDCTIAINDSFVSFLHGMINYTERGWVYADSFSSNKSWLCLNSYLPFCNKSPSSPIVLTHNSQIKLGNVDFNIEITEIS